jgi:cytochrome b6-f complex iron-sulfur subunit
MKDEPDREADVAPGSGAPEEEGDVRRRDLLERGLIAGAVIWAAGIAIPSGMYLWPAGSSGPTRRFIEVDPESLPPGTGRVLGGNGQPILLLRLKNGQFRALSAVCTHLGCIVHWNAGQQAIQCPCHAGVFTPEGNVVSGPPSRPLAAYPTQLVNGRLRIQV